LICPVLKAETISAVNEACENGARQTKACEMIGITDRTLQNWRRKGVSDKRKGAVKKVCRKLAEEEREAIIKICNNERFRDMNPHEIVAILAQEGIYMASESTMYRILRSVNMIHHRNNNKPKRKSSKPPEKVATGPNQVFTWDITWLHTTVRGIFLFAYVLIDIYDRSIVAWEIHDREDEELSRDMFKRVSKRHNLKGVHLHSDNGNPMKGVSLLGLLYSLGVSNSFSRPRVSNDNPFIEAFFKTLKYDRKYPGKFENLDTARNWFAGFIHWYNHEHLHSALGYVSPAHRRRGKDIILFQRRNETIEAARQKNPERWGKRNIRRWVSEATVILNPDKEKNDQDKKKTA